MAHCLGGLPMDDLKNDMLYIERKILNILKRHLDKLEGEDLEVKQLHSLVIIYGTIFDKLTGVGEQKSRKLEAQKIVDKQNRLEMLKRLAEEGRVD